MQFSTKAADPAAVKSGCVVVGVFEGRELTAAAKAIERASKGHLSRILAARRSGGAPGQHAAAARCTRNRSRARAPRRARQGSRFRAEGVPRSGPRRGASARRRRRIGGDAVPGRGEGEGPRPRVGTAARQQPSRPTSPIASTSSRARRTTRKPLARIALGLTGKSTRAEAAAVERGAALGAGQSLAKDLGNLPSNICTPSYLANQAQALARSHKLRCEVLEEKDMRKLGMGALLAVTKGAASPPSSSCSTTKVRARSTSRWCWSARASPSTPAASRSSPRPRWTR